MEPSANKTTKTAKAAWTLPSSFHEILREYEVLEGALSFLLKNRITPTLATLSDFLVKMKNDTSGACSSSSSLLPAAPSPASFDRGLSARRDIASFTGPEAGNVLRLQWVPTEPSGASSDLFRLEVSFVTIGSVGAGSSKRRVKAVEKALLGHAKGLHACFISALKNWCRLASSLLGVRGKVLALENGTWHPLWKWYHDGESTHPPPAFVLPDIPPPPHPKECSTAKQQDSEICISSAGFSSHLPPPLDADRGLTGRNATLLREMPKSVGSSSSSSSSSSLSSYVSSSSSSDSMSVEDAPATLDLKCAGDNEDVDPHRIIGALKDSPFYVDQCVHVHTNPASVGEYVSFEEVVFTQGARQGERVLSSVVEQRLLRRGVTHFFKHQALAVEAAMSGNHVAISTGTSSGKSVCYNVPVLEKICRDPSAVALYMFPTKALAQDQYQSLAGLAGCEEELLGGSKGSTREERLGHLCRPAVVDGDTPFQDRQMARTAANVILTNPDMLHVTVLPNHGQWERVLRNLSFVVVDEAHTYRGVFGAHVAMVLRRLVRLCQFYGNHSGPQFIYCSATIANVREHFEQLIPVVANRSLPGGNSMLTTVSEDTAPRGEKLLLLWNPPIIQPSSRLSIESGGGGGQGGVANSVKRGKKRALFAEKTNVDDNSDDGHFFGPLRDVQDKARTSTIVESSRIFTTLVKCGVRVLCFAPSRKITELILRYSQQDLQATAPTLVPLVKAYRGGYTKADRRTIERDFFSKRLLGVVATSALELGIDVGNLDATLHVGFPGSMSSLRQQSGRAGRSGRRSLAIIVCFDSPLDQLFCRTPSTLFGMEHERAIVPVSNSFVLRSQILCAARETPLRFVSRDPLQKMSNSTQSHENQDHLSNILAGALKESYSLEVEDDSLLFGPLSDVPSEIQYLLEEGTLVGITTSVDTSLTGLGSGRGKREGFPGERVTTTELLCHPSVDNPTRGANLRMIDPVTFSVIDVTRDVEDGGRAIDSIGYSRAFYELFEGAIYLHQASQYIVTKLDLRGNRALVKPVRVNYHTSSRNHTSVDVTKRLESGLGASSIVCTGNVNVVARVWGWRKHWAAGGKVKDMGTFTLPPLEFATRAFWIDVPPSIQAEIESLGSGQQEVEDQDGQSYSSCAPGLEGSEGSCCDEGEKCAHSCVGDANTEGGSRRRSQIGISSRSTSSSDIGDAPLGAAENAFSTCQRFLRSIHGLNHVLASVAPLFVLTDHDDIATEHIHPLSNRPRPPRVVIFDKRPGGTGVSQALFASAPALLTKAYEVLNNCPCQTGCLGCILDSRCSNLNLDKQSSTLLAKRILEVVRGVKLEGDDDGAPSCSKSSPPSSPGAQSDSDDDQQEQGHQEGISPFASTCSRQSWSSPRRRQRLLQARGMEDARERGAQVRPAWTNTMVPEFQSMFD